MKVLVVGATGVVGTQLVPQLLAAGHQVVATSRAWDRHVPWSTNPSVERHRLDLHDTASAERLVRELVPDVVVHQATALRDIGTNIRHFDRLFESTNRLRTDGTAALLRACREVRSRLVVQSFCGWPWAQVGGAVKSEDDPLDDDPPRAFRRTFAALRELESRTTAYEQGVVLRYGAFYGPGTSLTPGGVHWEAVRRRQFPLVGDGAGVWSFVHVADAASAVVAGLDHGRGVYNVVDDDPALVRTWLPLLAELVGAKQPRRVPSWVARLAAGEGAVRMMTTVRGSSNAKARRELDWQPSYGSWREGFAQERDARQRQPLTE